MRKLFKKKRKVFYHAYHHTLKDNIISTIKNIFYDILQIRINKIDEWYLKRYISTYLAYNGLFLSTLKHRNY